MSSQVLSILLNSFPKNDVLLLANAINEFMSSPKFALKTAKNIADVFVEWQYNKEMASPVRKILPIGIFPHHTSLHYLPDSEPCSGIPGSGKFLHLPLKMRQIINHN